VCKIVNKFYKVYIFIQQEEGDSVVSALPVSRHEQCVFHVGVLSVRHAEDGIEHTRI